MTPVELAQVTRCLNLCLLLTGCGRQHTFILSCTYRNTMVVGFGIGFGGTQGKQLRVTPRHGQVNGNCSRPPSFWHCQPRNASSRTSFSIPWGVARSLSLNLCPPCRYTDTYIYIYIYIFIFIYIYVYLSIY